MEKNAGATIIQFPAGGRRGLQAKKDPVQTPLPAVVIDSWYHEAAVAAETKRS